MRNVIVGIIAGIVIGILLGTTVVAPRLERAAPLLAGAEQQRPSEAIAKGAHDDTAPMPPAAAKTEKSAVGETPPAKATSASAAKSSKPASNVAPAPAAIPVPPVTTTILSSAYPPTVRPSAIVSSAPGHAIRWKMASAFPGSLPVLGPLGKRIDREIWRISGGEMELKFYEPNTLIPISRMLDAVGRGTLDAAFATPSLWAKGIPPLKLFAATPFGPPPEEFMAWYYFGGGKEIYQGIYRKVGVHALLCGLTAPEASGWFRKKVRTIDDLKGLTMQIRGLGSKVIARLGVRPRDLKDDEILSALERGDIDAAEFSLPSIDRQVGLQSMAPNYYFPGWHQQATVLELLLNRARWDALSPIARSRLEAVCGDAVRHALAKSESSQFASLKAMQAENVSIQRWPSEILDALRGEWEAVALQESQTNAGFRRVWESLKKFRREYGIWNELGHP